jgi:hypothetical protein
MKEKKTFCGYSIDKFSLGTLGIHSKNISFKVSRYKTEPSQNKNLTRISLLHELI